MNTPLTMGKNFIKRLLAETGKRKKNYTSLEAKQIEDLLAFVLRSSFFKCGENFYHKISGCAMGSPVSAVIAELVMQEVETMAIASSPSSPTHV